MFYYTLDTYWIFDNLDLLAFFVLHMGERHSTSVKDLVRSTVRQTLPFPIRRLLWAQWSWLCSLPTRIDRWWAIKRLRYGGARLKPIRRAFGSGYGQCIDRYYIENFLDAHSEDIHGRVLEVSDNIYTYRFGGSKVRRSDVLHVTPDSPRATIIADITTDASHIESETFDCVILTQTIHLIYDFRAALRTVYRILKPGGVLLATFPGISQICRKDMEQWGDYWRLTSVSSRLVFAEFFPEDCISVHAYGNVFTSIALLHGLLSTELRKDELDYHDPDYEMLITVKAMKPRI
jgi:SAM-dependent methyltransferase